MPGVLAMSGRATQIDHLAGKMPTVESSLTVLAAVSGRPWQGLHFLPAVIPIVSPKQGFCGSAAQRFKAGA